MQLLARILIAAVFFGLGAWVVFSEFGPSNNSSGASSNSPTTTTTPRTPGPSATLSPAHNGAPSPISTRTPTPTHTPTHTPGRTSAQAPARTPTPTPTRSPRRTPTATRSTATPTPTRTTPTPSGTATTSPAPAVPLTASIGAVQCPARTVTVKVTNVSTQAVDYSIEQDGTPTVADRVGPGTTRTSKLSLKEDDSSQVAVVWTNKTLKSAKRTANCTHPSRHTSTPAPAKSLPHTGADSASVVAKAATGVAAMITGVVIFWYGGIWPRRRDEALRELKR